MEFLFSLIYVSGFIATFIVVVLYFIFDQVASREEDIEKHIAYVMMAFAVALIWPVTVLVGLTYLPVFIANKVRDR